MNKMIKVASVVAVTVALAQSLQAIPVTGAVGFAGAVTFNNTSALNATAVTSWITPTVQTDYGSFAVVPNGTPVAFNPGTWYFNSSVFPGSLTYPINNFWTVGGFTFTLLSTYLIYQNGTPGVNAFVVVDGTGTVSGNGYTPTQMSWSFTSQDPASGSNPTSWTFSASANAVVPDGGATVMLLGIALSGVALLRKKLAA
jgi:hypothetical protein